VPRELTFGSLFAGIGGFDLGLERAGMRCLWQCEIDPYCQRVLARHWPDLLLLRDVRGVRADTVPDVRVLAGGFPCQDVSRVGPRTGLDGARSGLWSEYARVVGELRPDYVIVENVPGLLTRGFERVLGDLAALGYDAEWDCLSASAFGAPHVRDRVWLVAYPQSDGRGPRRAGRPAGGGQGQAEQAHRGGVADAGGGRHGLSPEAVRPGRNGTFDPGWWATEPELDRVAHGVPDQVDRLRGVGNALLPQIAEWIGRRILEHEGAA
jgi:DNA (cytosine-5)-methyltransferase 1